MEAVFYSQARNNLRTIITDVCDNFNEYIITTKDNQSAVLISQDEYNSMKETMYLLSSRSNRERLMDSVDEIENLQYTKKDINL